MKQAFSLVELSIVLVILGLLTGGILTGQNLIRAAELRSVTTEFSAYQTAVNTFRDKYFALPGDMRNATDFWGSATCPATAGTGTQTCNGNGDGIIQGSAGGNAYKENFTFWQHLSSAGLIEGSYSGIAGSATYYDSVINANTPASKLSSAGWSVYWHPQNWAGDSGWLQSSRGNMLTFGANVSGSLNFGAILRPEEAWNIDTKMDDGTPGQGRIVAVFWDDCTLAADETDITADYDLSRDSNECGFSFLNPF